MDVGYWNAPITAVYTDITLCGPAPMTKTEG